jgi:hypothetical protein
MTWRAGLLIAQLAGMLIVVVVAVWLWPKEIGIGGSLTAPPLPHHRTYGSVYGGSAD